MLSNRFLSTIKFFDLQDYPVTLLELHRFLVADLDHIRKVTNAEGEVDSEQYDAEIPMDAVLHCIDSECRGMVENTLGFYHLPGRREIVEKRLANYRYGIRREKLIKKFVRFVRCIPFVRGVAVGGSQAMGPQKSSSDIDLLILTHDKFLWLARTLVTMYFQVIGHRRHGSKIANRFCLNHYLSHPKALEEYRNLYTAMEYGRLRPLVYPQNINQFQKNNSPWMQALFPNLDFEFSPVEEQGVAQKFFEMLLGNKVGEMLEHALKSVQLPRIHRGEKFIVVTEDELSFHPQSKQQGLLAKFQ